MANTILTWQEVVLATSNLVGNKEQNAHFPPHIASNAGRLVTDFLLDSIARIYPNNDRIVDKARPFLKRKLLNVENGLVVIPEDYRNVLTISIATNENKTAPCSCPPKDCDDCGDDPIDETNSGLFENGKRTESCTYRKLDILSSDEYDLRSISKLRPPTYNSPIGMFIDRTTFKVCPRTVTHIEIRYLKQPLKSEIGYKLMPDDTWQIDTSSTSHIELEWERNIFPEFFKAFTSLYSIHTRDGSLVNWNKELNQIGLF